MESAVIDTVADYPRLSFPLYRRDDSPIGMEGRLELDCSNPT